MYSSAPIFLPPLRASGKWLKRLACCCFADDVWQTIFLDWMPFDVVIIVRRHYGCCCCCGCLVVIFFSSCILVQFSGDTTQSCVCISVEKRGRNFKWLVLDFFFALLFVAVLFVARYLFTAHLETVLDCALNKWRTKLTLPLSPFGYAMLFIYLLIFPYIFFFAASLRFSPLLGSFGAFLHLTWSTTHYLCDNVWWRNLHMTVTVDIFAV